VATLFSEASNRKELKAFFCWSTGIIGWFVSEAVRRKRVVSVSITGLRRITVCGLMLSVPVLFAPPSRATHGRRCSICRAGLDCRCIVCLFLIGRLHELWWSSRITVFNALKAGSRRN